MATGGMKKKTSSASNDETNDHSFLNEERRLLKASMTTNQRSKKSTQKYNTRVNQMTSDEMNEELTRQQLSTRFIHLSSKIFSMVCSLEVIPKFDVLVWNMVIVLNQLYAKIHRTMWKRFSTTLLWLISKQHASKIERIIKMRLSNFQLF